MVCRQEVSILTTLHLPPPHLCFFLCKLLRKLFLFYGQLLLGIQPSESEHSRTPMLWSCHQVTQTNYCFYLPNFCAAFFTQLLQCVKNGKLSDLSINGPSWGSPSCDSSLQTRHKDRSQSFILPPGEKLRGCKAEIAHQTPKTAGLCARSLFLSCFFIFLRAGFR